MEKVQRRERYVENVFLKRSRSLCMNIKIVTNVQNFICVIVLTLIIKANEYPINLKHILLPKFILSNHQKLFILCLSLFNLCFILG